MIRRIPTSAFKLPKIELAELNKCGVVSDSINQDNMPNYLKVFKKINNNEVLFISNYLLNNIEVFNAINLRSYYHGCDTLIIRLIDYDIAIYYREFGELVPVNESSYVNCLDMNIVSWKKYTEKLVISDLKTGLIINPEINQGRKYFWYINGLKETEQIPCGTVSRTDHFDEFKKITGTAYIWDLCRFKAEDIIINFCSERPSDIMPVAIDNENKVAGFYYKNEEFKPLPQGMHINRISQIIKERKLIYRDRTTPL